MKAVRFHPEAEIELAAESLYYEERVAGLGSRFLQEVEAATRLAAAFSGIGSPYKYRTRRVFPKSFPFCVIYRELPLEIVILAVAPFARKPSCWRHRTNKN